MGMNASRWKTPAAFFPWPHVQRYIDSIDATVYRVAVDQELTDMQAEQWRDHRALY
jgi:hypothetical protein